VKNLLFVLLLLSMAASSKEDCSLEEISLDKNSNIAEQLFYTGTCHYRNEDYGQAVDSWERLSALENLEPEHEELKIDVLNNLGYMMFFGYGTEQNQQKAITYWQQAIIMGHEEAEYHLCHAYADKKEGTYNLHKARQHCKKALLIYRGMEEPDKDILKDINRYLKVIND